MKKEYSNKIYFGTINLFIYDRTRNRPYSKYDFKNV